MKRESSNTNNGNNSISQVLSDANLVAFLVMRGFVAIPFIANTERREGEEVRVLFDVQGSSERVKANTDDYYQNDAVGVRDFVKALRDVKSGLWNLKQINEQD